MRRMRYRVGVLAAIMLLAFSLSGCGANETDSTASNEDMQISNSKIEEAVELDWQAVSSERLENEARAKQDWEGKTVRYTATVATISSEYAHVYNEMVDGMLYNPIDVYLSADDLVKPNKDDVITVVGTLDIYGKIKDAELIEINGE